MPRVSWVQRGYMPKWRSEDELALLRDLCQKDFWTFFLYCFGAGRNPKGKRWIDPSIHEPLANWYQFHVDEWLKARSYNKVQQKHLAVVVHREVGKTTMITQAGQLWLHLRDPEISSYTGSEKTEHAMLSLGAIKSVLDGSDPYSLWTTLYGDWGAGSKNWTGKQIVHGGRKNVARRDPSIGTFAVETSIVGAHPDAIFYDDPISYDRLSTDSEWLAAVNSQVTSLYPVIQSDGLVVWVGTRYDDEDHFGVAFRDEGVKSLTGMETDSLKVTDEGLWDVFFMCGRDIGDEHPDHPGGVPSSPLVWPEERLRRYKQRDPIRYAAQVMNDPQISELNPITKEQLRQMIMPSKEVPWSSMRFAITCDTAFWDGGKHIGKDETVYLVWGYPRNGSGDVYFIEGYGSNMWRAEDLAKRLVTTVQRYRGQNRRIFAITDEITMAGKKGTWRITLKNYFSDVNEPMPNFIEFSRGGKKKSGRIAQAATFWVDGHVRLVEGAPGLERLIDQMGKIGQYLINPNMHDDWADAAADAFEPELYQPMRRQGSNNAPWDPNSRLIPVDGLDTTNWLHTEQNPRPPLK